MRQLVLTIYFLALTGCLSGGSSDSTGASAPAGNSAVLKVSSKTPDAVNSGGNTDVTLTGNFPHDGDGVDVSTNSGRHCGIKHQKQTEVQCTFPPQYVNDDPNQGLVTTTEPMTVTQTLPDGTTQTTDAGLITFAPAAVLEFSGVFTVQAGAFAAYNSGWVTNASANVPAMPYIHGFSISNTSTVDATYDLKLSVGQVASPFSSTCGDTQRADANGNLEITGTLAAGTSCTWTMMLNFTTSDNVTYQFTLPTADGTHPAGTVFENDPATLTYNDGIGDTVTVNQDVSFVYSN